MTTGVLKQDPNTRKVKKNATYYDKTQQCECLGIRPFFQAIKQQLNDS